MRYSVNTEGLLSCCKELEEAARRLRRDSETLENTIQRLKRLSYMDAVCVQLRREREKLEERIQLTLTMAQAARRCRDTYQLMEQRIMEELDCPHHVLTEGGTGAASQGYIASVTAGSGAPAAFEWELKMEAYVAAFTQAGINVRLAD